MFVVLRQHFDTIESKGTIFGSAQNRKGKSTHFRATSNSKLHFSIGIIVVV